MAQTTVFGLSNRCDGLSQITGSNGAPSVKPTYAATVTINPDTAIVQEIAGVNATSATCTISASYGGKFGQWLRLILADTGGVTYTFTATAGNFVNTGTVNPGDGNKIIVDFQSDGTNWREVCRTRVAGAIPGTATNDNAPTGGVGQIVQTLVAVGSAVSLTTATAKSVASVSLTAGDWDVEANLNFTMGSATTAVTSAFTAGISTTDNTLPTDGSEVEAGGFVATTSSFKFGVPISRKRISIATTTSVYLVGLATFSAGTAGGYGVINARRVR